MNSATAKPSGPRKAGRVDKAKLDHWRDTLNGSRLPVFARTVKDVKDIAASRATSAKDLSEVVGHDASMAARVIQIANSPLFNLQNKNIDSINAAVVMVGFDAVREIAISVGVVEEMLKGYQHERVGTHLSRAFHAAAQARSFANKRGVKADEVFVAALLHHVGDMAFWSRADREAVALEARLRAGVSSEEAEREILGFALSDLSRALADDWHLGDLVAVALNPRRAEQDDVKDVLFGHEAARLLEIGGWNSDEGRRLKAKLADHLQVKVGALDDLLETNYKTAMKIAERCGVKPQPLRAPAAVEVPEQTMAPAGAAQRDAPTFLQALLDIGNALEEGASRDELMRLALHGLHRGLGLEQALFALLNPERDRLTVKYAAGQNGEQRVGDTVQVESDAQLARVIHETGVLRTEQPVQGLSSEDDRAAILVASRIGGKSVGVLFGELPGGEGVDDDQVAGFRQIGQQIGLILVQSSR